jgi:hypothetical protein
MYIFKIQNDTHTKDWFFSRFIFRCTSQLGDEKRGNGVLIFDTAFYFFVHQVHPLPSEIQSASQLHCTVSDLIFHKSVVRSVGDDGLQRGFSC